MLVTSDIYTLINYVGFINYLFYGVTVAGQIVLRWKKPDINRPIKVLEPPCGTPSPPPLLLAELRFFKITLFSLLTKPHHLHDGGRPFGKQRPCVKGAAISILHGTRANCSWRNRFDDLITSIMSLLPSCHSFVSYGSKSLKSQLTFPGPSNLTSLLLVPPHNWLYSFSLHLIPECISFSHLPLQILTIFHTQEPLLKFPSPLQHFMILPF